MELAGSLNPLSKISKKVCPKLKGGPETFLIPLRNPESVFSPAKK
jgi:hypothetical protein